MARPDKALKLDQLKQIMRDEGVIYIADTADTSCYIQIGVPFRFETSWCADELPDTDVCFVMYRKCDHNLNRVGGNGKFSTKDYNLVENKYNGHGIFASLKDAQEHIGYENLI